MFDVKQLTLPLPRSPKKPRRGRPPLTEAERRRRGSLVRRVARPAIKARHPLHITLRTRQDVPYLRRKARFLRVRRALRAAADRFGMRVVHFAVMGDHVHLIVEAHDKAALSRGMQGLAIRVARAINRGERSGKVFRDRYHAVVLDSPRHVRNAVAYVLLNSSKHARGARATPWVDPFTSGAWFDGWARPIGVLGSEEPSPVAAPRTWLLGVGWRRTRLIDPDEVPGAR